MTKFYNDLMEGLTAMEEFLDGKRTLKMETLARHEPLEMQAEEIKAIREELNLSQALFALKLRTSVRTYQGWEQGKSKPNQQAMLLLKMVQKSPQLFEQIANA